MHPFVEKRKAMKDTLEATLSAGTHHTTAKPLGAHLAVLEDALAKLPDGFILSAQTMGIRPQPVDSFVLARTLRTAFEATGIKPDIKRTSAGVWVNEGTVERMYDAHISAVSKGTPDPVEQIQDVFTRDIAWSMGR